MLASGLLHTSNTAQTLLLVHKGQVEPVDLSGATRTKFETRGFSHGRAPISAALSLVAHSTRGPAPQVRSHCLTLVARAARRAAAR